MTISPTTRRFIRAGITSCAVLMLATGVYLLLLVASPSVAPLIAVTKPIDPAKLPAPKATDNRIIIPKIGVDIAYGTGPAALDRGAEWRYPDRGDPVSGGNFIIAAHRLSIQPTPMGTIEKSPFYHIDELHLGDHILIDFKGVRYTYTITKTFTVKPTQVEIEAPSETAKLTLYSCELSGSAGGRNVIIATKSSSTAAPVSMNR